MTAPPKGPPGPPRASLTPPPADPGFIQVLRPRLRAWASGCGAGPRSRTPTLKSKLAKLELRAPIFAGLFPFGVVGGRTPESCKVYASRKPPYSTKYMRIYGGGDNTVLYGVFKSFG